jgi:ArsR family transcriptional regulator
MSTDAEQLARDIARYLSITGGDADAEHVAAVVRIVQEAAADPQFLEGLARAASADGPPGPEDAGPAPNGRLLSLAVSLLTAGFAGAAPRPKALEDKGANDPAALAGTLLAAAAVVERSSLGTPRARELRNQTRAADVAAVREYYEQDEQGVQRELPALPSLGAGELTSGEAEQMAVMFKALADPVRLRLFSRVAAPQSGEASVCDIQNVGVSQPTVSHHLKKLREAGLVISERRGTWVYVRVAPGVLSAMAQMLSPGNNPRTGTPDPRETLDPTSYDLSLRQT